MKDKLNLYTSHMDEMIEKNVERLNRDVEILIKFHDEGDMDGVIEQLKSLIMGATSTIGLVTPSIVLKDFESRKGGQGI